MLKVENVVTPSEEQWRAVVYGVRNPYASWEKSDSEWIDGFLSIGDADKKLMKKLSLAGDDHGKFMRMLPVICDITAPLTWWKQCDQYKIGTVTDSESTMHCIQKEEFNINMFEHEDIDDETLSLMLDVVDELNRCRNLYNETLDLKYWNSMINLLPESYMQRRTWSGNYQVLKNIYFARRNHKLGDWHTFCDWIKTLPLSDLITGE